MLFKDSEINYIFKKEKPSVSLGDFITSVPASNNKDKKFRVRALLKGNIVFYVRKKRVHSRILGKEKRDLPLKNEYYYQKRANKQIVRLNKRRLINS